MRAIVRYGIASSFGLKAGTLSGPVPRVHHAVQRKSCPTEAAFTVLDRDEAWLLGDRIRPYQAKKPTAEIKQASLFDVTPSEDSALLERPPN
jgi:hypothetical protein